MRTDERKDRLADITKLSDAFRNFCESIQNVQIAKCTQHLLRMQGTRNPKLVHE